MRLLVIDDENRKQAQAVVEFAQRPENWYLVGPGGQTGGPPPGNNPRHVARINTYRCVFSYTKAPEGLFRHLSISVPSDKYPSTQATCEIARMFGFIGWDGRSPIESMLKDGRWMAEVNKAEHCVVLAQKIERNEANDGCGGPATHDSR